MVLKKQSLAGKVAVVTGAAGGLGSEVARTFAKAGADVAVTDFRAEPLEKTAQDIRNLGRKVIALVADITKSREIDLMIESTIAEFGKIDILMNTAGIARGIDIPIDNDSIVRGEQRKPIRETTDFERKPIWKITDDEWRMGIDVNLSGAFYCCRAVAKHLVGQKSGKVINVASGGGLRGMRDNYMYCCAKGGIIQLTRVLAITWAQDNIQVNCIAPGRFDSGHLPPERKAATAAFTPVGRVGEVQEFGSLGLFLASDASDYITGEVFLCDGGVLGGAHAPVGYAPIISIKEE
jgi:NAD(P)-dependent dehydrogenase (short-subunit alcohol dehydrogenase family)